MPAHTAYICRVRTDIDAGTLQWTDLKPNASQHVPSLESGPQTGYLKGRAENDTLAALSANKTVAEYSGLAAYLIDNVQDAVSGVTITVTIANATAVAILALLDAGSAVTSTAIASALVAAGAGAGTTLTSSGGTGTVIDILKILSGQSYTLPSGSTVGGLATPAELGSFDSDGYRQLYMTGAMHISCGEGQLAAYAASTFSLGGVAGRAIVVYDYAGNVLT